jgi:hypothetical protein
VRHRAINGALSHLTACPVQRPSPQVSERLCHLLSRAPRELLVPFASAPRVAGSAGMLARLDKPIAVSQRAAGNKLHDRASRVASAVDEGPEVRRANALMEQLRAGTAAEESA